MNKILFSLVFVASMGWLVTNGLSRNERHECLVWQSESHRYVGWYAAGWQTEQCNHYKISLAN